MINCFNYNIDTEKEKNYIFVLEFVYCALCAK